MIALIAGLYWALLAWTTSPQAQSQIKLSYPAIAFIEQARERFLASLIGYSADATGLVAGLSIGERDMVSDELAEAMKTLSLTHLIAVSGANLAIVMGLVYLVVGAMGLSRGARLAAALSLMVLYVLLVGPESSVIRAAVMATFVSIGLWIGRGSAPINGLAIAILVLLVLDPALSVDFGFALSALATAGLLILSPAIYLSLSTKMPKWLAVGLAATFSAQLYTLPVLLLLQPSIPIYSVIANLVVEPTVAPITIIGMATVLLATWLPPLAALASYLASIPAQWIVLVAHSLHDLPLARISFIPGPLGVATIAVLTAALTLRLTAKQALLRAASTLVLATLMALSAGWVVRDYARQATFSGDWEVIACDVGQGDAMLIRGEQVALVDTGNDPQALASCLDAASVDRIDLLVLTHFDLDHVGAASSIAERVVGPVMVTGFRDDRPVVETINRTFGSERIVVGAAGLSGSLGGASWSVLAPSQGARDAQDSNDASLVMLFELGPYAVLALGDLGEVGQIRLLRQQSVLLNQLANTSLIVKVAHHGSADQSEELMRILRPEVAVFSVGQNAYGHPTKSAIAMAEAVGAKILRTDEVGSIAFGAHDEGLGYRVAGKLTT